MTDVRTLRPGFLVSLSVKLSGGVEYARRDLDAPAEASSSPAAVTRWETTKVIDDPAEYAAATEIRGKARRLVASICVNSDFGLLCPAAREAELAAAIVAARDLATKHNQTARQSFVRVYCITGQIAADDVEATRAVAAEVKGLLDEMNRGISAGDADAIRAAATKARMVGAMLSDVAGAKVSAAIEAARAAAREIVKRVTKGGELAEVVVKELDCKALDAARGAFLDLDDLQVTEAAPVAAAALDLPPEAAPAVAPEAAPVVTQNEIDDFLARNAEPPVVEARDEERRVAERRVAEAIAAEVADSFIPAPSAVAEEKRTPNVPAPVSPAPIEF